MLPTTLNIPSQIIFWLNLAMLHDIFYCKFLVKFSAELSRRKTVNFPEISGKIPPKISALAIRVWMTNHHAGASVSYVLMESPMDSPAMTETTPTEIDCARQCLTNVQCLAFAVNTNVQLVGGVNCRLYYQLTSGLKLDNGVITYFTDGQLVPTQ